MEPSAKRPRISVDVPPEVRRRLRLAAAKRDLTVGQYVMEAIEERLREDLGEYSEGVLALTAKADPVLAELWDNRKDSEYDRL
jgi:predicted DNA-binding protein